MPWIRRGAGVPPAVGDVRCVRPVDLGLAYWRQSKRRHDLDRVAAFDDIARRLLCFRFRYQLPFRSPPSGQGTGLSSHHDRQRRRRVRYLAGYAPRARGRHLSDRDIHLRSGDLGGAFASTGRKPLARQKEYRNTKDTAPSRCPCWADSRLAR